MLGMSSDDFLAAARARAGLHDFGDERWMPAFRKMIESVNRSSRFTDNGRKAACDRFLRLLVNRLRYVADVKAHPEILAEEILSPLVILGLPRTGSTKIQRMIGESGDFRSMLMWQGYNPAPFPDAPPDGPDPRIEDAARFLAWRSAKHASISRAHHTEAQEPEEELYLVEASFTNWAAGGYYEMPAYLDWIRRIDRTYVYEHVHRMLQYLQWQHHRGAPPRRWVLKSPPNLGHEHAMLAAFPGAHFVMLHRSPVEAVASIISLTCGMRHQYLAEAPSPAAIGEWMLREYRDILDRHMAWRDAGAGARVMDVAYRDILARDIEVVDAVYAFCGMDMADEARARMAQWSARNRQHSHGAHEYSLDGTNLTPGAILETLSRYRDRFKDYL